MITASKAESNVLETVFYQTSLAKFYIDKDKIDMCMELLEEMKEIVKSSENLSNEADYIKRKRKSKNHPEALILSRFWTVQAQLLNASENYNEAVKCLNYALMAIKKMSKKCWSLKANINNLVGIISFKCKKYHDAEHFHRRALEILTSQNRYIDKDIYLTNIGNAKVKQWEQDSSCEAILEDAERYYTMALNLETTQRINKAKILSLRGKLYLRLLKLEESENDLQESLNLWKTLVDSPNVNLISAYHLLSTLLLRKFAHLLEKDEVNESSNCLGIVMANYTEIQKQIREGGLNNWQRYKVLYGQIKKNHKRILLHLNREKEEIDEIERFYLDFEAGKFDNFTGNKFMDPESVSSDSTQVERESMNSNIMDSSSSLSSCSSLRVTSEDEEDISTGNSSNKLLTKTAAIKDSLEKKCPLVNSYRSQIDSGLGGSISSPILPQSDYKGKFCTSQSSSVEEDVFLQNDVTRTNCEQMKRKLSEKSKTWMLKRQKITL